MTTGEGKVKKSVSKGGVQGLKESWAEENVIKLKQQRKKEQEKSEQKKNVHGETE